MRLRTAILALACTAACLADTLTLRNGSVIQGTYMGGTARTVKIQTADSVTTYEVTDVATLQFTPPAPAAPAAPALGGGLAGTHIWPALALLLSALFPAMGLFPPNPIVEGTSVRVAGSVGTSVRSTALEEAN